MSTSFRGTGCSFRTDAPPRRRDASSSRRPSIWSRATPVRFGVGSQRTSSSGIGDSRWSGDRQGPDSSINLGGATAADVLALIDLMQRQVREKMQVELELEVRVVGDD